jgi:hypothetical protein
MFAYMSTAIVRIYTRDGFVIAADGRTSDKSGAVRDDATQKVFPMTRPSMHLAYAIAGDVQIVQRATGEVLLDLHVATKEAFEVIADRPESWPVFSTLLANTILDRVECARRLREFHRVEEGKQASLFIDGYHNGQPRRTHVKFKYTCAPQQKAKKVVIPNDLCDNYGYGSKLVQAAIDSGDSRFAQFQPATIREGMSLDEAIIVARNRIAAQFGDYPPGLEIDPKCRHIGGRILIALVTPSGFDWIEGLGSP